ncbi:acyl-CoA-binding protein [Salinisphaera sp. RV14]|uniref:acyl-CoA-binding protein n=1 Tax=unclassified Salinisphaera TaxID=2649847 RepID=UPI003F8503A0
MSDIKKGFDEAVDKVRNAPADGESKPSQAFQLKMYGLYRQAVDGDVTGKKPSLINPGARYKWQAWKDNEGMSREDAMAAYVAEVDKIEAEYS